MEFLASTCVFIHMYPVCRRGRSSHRRITWAVFFSHHWITESISQKQILGSEKRALQRCGLCELKASMHPFPQVPPHTRMVHTLPFGTTAFIFLSISHDSSVADFFSPLSVRPIISVKYLTPADRDRWIEQHQPPAQLQ